MGLSGYACTRACVAFFTLRNKAIVNGWTTITFPKCTLKVQLCPLWVQMSMLSKQVVFRTILCEISRLENSRWSAVSGILKLPCLAPTIIPWWQCDTTIFPFDPIPGDTKASIPIPIPIPILLDVLLVYMKMMTFTMKTCECDNEKCVLYTCIRIKQAAKYQTLFFFNQSN